MVYCLPTTESGVQELLATANRLRVESDAQRAQIDAQRAQIDAQQAQIDAQRVHIDAQRVQMATQLWLPRTKVATTPTHTHWKRTAPSSANSCEPKHAPPPATPTLAPAPAPVCPLFGLFDDEGEEGKARAHAAKSENGGEQRAKKTKRSGAISGYNVYISEQTARSIKTWGSGGSVPAHHWKLFGPTWQALHEEEKEAYRVKGRARTEERARARASPSVVD
mgnify:CR=1 FL=1|tara:strand:- start:323 stop:988 length:666 start_codon:yes stop_codon:yes gene_type:complete